MQNSNYLKEKYISTGLAKTFHSALVMDYFGLSAKEMEKIGMTVVAWGFSYQVKDKRKRGQNGQTAQSFYCDFKFRSGTFNAGYVGAPIQMKFVKING